MVDDADAEVVLGWMREHCRQQPWRVLDGKGRTRVSTVCVVELSRSKLRSALKISEPRCDAALKVLFDGGHAVPLGRMLPMETCQAVELWKVNG